MGIHLSTVQQHTLHICSCMIYPNFSSSCGGERTSCKGCSSKKVCSILWFATKSELRGLCHVFGELTGQRCHLPKSSEPKMLWISNIINGVCGSDVGESWFTPRTEHNGIAWNLMACLSSFITIRYSRDPSPQRQVGALKIDATRCFLCCWFVITTLTRMLVMRMILLLLLTMMKLQFSKIANLKMMMSST